MISIDITKAKEVAHTVRRSKRDKEFELHDAVIMKQIPGSAVDEAEAARAEIRAKYETIQNNIDASSTIDELKNIIDNI